MSDHKEQYSTGYSPQALPLYQELDSGAFEQFCTDLLNLHPVVPCLRNGRVVNRRIVNASRFLSGRTPQKGADIRADAEAGEVWFFQCKRVKQFGLADVVDAVEEAETKLPHADQFVLITTCGLNKEAEASIYARPKWLWWDASRLTMEVLRLRPREDAINFVHRFFGPDWKKKLFASSDQPLLTWQEFFAQDLSSQRRYVHHRVPFVPWGGAMAQLESFARSGAGRALVLSAAGGQGKSRLLLALAQKLEEQPDAPRARFLNLNGSGLSAEQMDFISREDSPLLLMVDDAHRLEGAMENVARAAARTECIRLIVATRPQALEAVQSHLHAHGYAERLDEPLQLARWTQANIETLAERVLDPQHRKEAPRLMALADKCPLLVVLGGALINSGGWPETMTSEETFRERVFRSFKDDFLNCQLTTKRERLDRIIRFISFISPAPKNDALLSKAAEIVGCQALDVADDLDALQAAGMLVENREGIRLYPDLFLDAVLLDAVLDHGGKASALYRAVLAKMAPEEFPALIRNIAQADWEARTRKGATSSLFDPIWNAFLQRFEAGQWSEGPTDLRRWIFDPARGYKEREEDRAELLGHWASFAVYLPERTLELAELALKSAVASSSLDRKFSENQNRAPAAVDVALPPMLKPIVIWHHDYARRALEILWSLEPTKPRGDREASSDAIGAIADAASFAIEKPIRTSEIILEWLEQKLGEPAAMERLQRHPWILNALLKPFFGRTVERNWMTARKLHIRSYPVPVERTRPLREKALAITKRLLMSEEAALCHAVIPVVQEAIHPSLGRFGSGPTESEQVSWRVDRLQALEAIESAIGAQKNSAVLLLQLSRILRSRSEHDPDEVVRKECCRVLSTIPNTFELRVARVLTSWAHDEVDSWQAAEPDAGLRVAEEQWSGFCRSVAQEVVERFKTAPEVCEFIRGQVQELTAANCAVVGDALLGVIAGISPAWSAGLLDELIASRDATLDRFLWAVIQRAAIHARDSYHRAIQSLPDTGRSEQVCSLINFLGGKHLHGGGLDEKEREAVLSATKRTEIEVVVSLASVAGLHFANDPVWGMDILSRLKPSSQRDGVEIMEALGRLSEDHAAQLDTEKVAQCLANLGDFLFPDNPSAERNLEKVAKAFPRQMYEQVRAIYEKLETGCAEDKWRGFRETLALGQIDDPEFLSGEIEALWKRATAADDASFSRRFRLTLVRSLLQAENHGGLERIGRLIADAKSGAELQLVAELVAPPESAFVLQHPEMVRAVLARGQALGVEPAVRKTLLNSTCLGARSFTEGEIDPEYRYILERGEALANRYRDDPLLGRLYREISEFERRNLEDHRARFRAEDDAE